MNREVGLEGRDKELSKPLLQLFHGTKAYDEVKIALMSFLDKKNKRKKNVSIDPVLYEIMVNLVSKHGEKIYNSAIWQAIQDNIPGADIDPKDWSVALENPTLNTTECCRVCIVAESITQAERG